MHKLVPACSVIFILSACAQKPENIAAVPVAGDPYSRFSCSQLAQERLKISQELEVVGAQQLKAANNDALGVFMLGLPLASMSGNDKEATIAIAKGRIQEIDTQRQRKNCR